MGFDPVARTVKVAYDVTFDESMANRANNLRTFDGTEDFQITAEGNAVKKQARQLKDDITRAALQKDLDLTHFDTNGAADEEESDQEELWEDQDDGVLANKEPVIPNDMDRYVEVGRLGGHE